VVATATVLSVLTSIAGDTTSKNGPSFVRAEGIGVESAEAEAALLRERTRDAEGPSSEGPEYEDFTVVAGEPTSDETADEAVEDDESEDDLDEFTRLRDRLDPDD
jgi:hypothetical protein